MRFGFPSVLLLAFAVCVGLGAPPRGHTGGKKEPEAKPIVFDSALGDADAKDKKLKGSRAKVHDVKLDQGVVYVIDLASKAFDAFLRIEDADGKPLAEDDDGAGGTNARLFFIPPASAVYRLVATSYNAKAGAYRLTVQKSDLQATPLKLDKDSATVKDRLAVTGPRSPLSPHNNCRVYRVELKAGTSYTIDLKSTDFDSFLVLADARLIHVASDDDSGGKLNARLRFACKHDATYYLVATGLGEPIGAFTLTVRKAD